jgi:adenylate cyclase
MRATARPETARKDIALVQIDETSLRNLEPLAGRWPWPRIVHSEVIDFLARGPAKVVGYDVNFAGPDTRKGFDFGAGTMSGADSDHEWARSVKDANNVVMLTDATFDAEMPNAAPVPDMGYSALDVDGVYDTKSLLVPFPELTASASGLGHNLFILDPDGVMRHMVPFVRSNHRVLPSLGTAAALRAGGFKTSDVRLEGTQLRIGDRLMPMTDRKVTSSEQVKEGDKTRTVVSLRHHLWYLMNYRGSALGADLATRIYKTYSFYDLLYSEEQIRANQKPDIDPALFKDKVVFVGITAAGLFDVFETPFANGATPGINIHAAVADDILSNRFLDEAPGSVRIASAVGAALAIGVVATTLPAWWATGIAVLLIVLQGWVSTRLFAAGHWVNLSQPVLASALALFGGVGYLYFVEGREKRKMKKLFGQYVSKDVYDHLVADPTLARLGGARREMSVLFSDIRGFTTVSERGQPEDIVHTLNEYFTKMVDIVFKHEGTVDKFVGDMVMALFGAPLADPRHAEHAVAAALDMIDELTRLNEGWRAQNRPTLDIGIGINTGPMIAGNIGSAQIMSYTVIGDAVNLGSRLESLNKNYGTRIIISEATKAQLTGSYDMKPLGDVVVKGKTQPVAIFQVIERSNPKAGEEEQKEHK